MNGIHMLKCQTRESNRRQQSAGRSPDWTRPCWPKSAGSTRYVTGHASPPGRRDCLSVNSSSCGNLTPVAVNLRATPSLCEKMQEASFRAHARLPMCTLTQAGPAHNLTVQQTHCRGCTLLHSRAQRITRPPCYKDQQTSDKHGNDE
jgi:hypothetical protein